MSVIFNQIFIHKEMLPRHTHIYRHPQTDCFVVSQLFSVARHVGRLKLGSKPAQLYVDLVSDRSAISIIEISH